MAKADHRDLDDLQILMGRMGEAYFYNGEIPADVFGTDAAAPTKDIFEESDFAMPLSKEGVNFEFGAATINVERITEGRAWYTFAEDGDENITMQVPSLAADVNELFLDKETTAAVSVKAGGKTYSGDGYNTKTKKVKGAWVFTTPEKDVIVILPKTDNYANLVGASGDAKSYYNVQVKTFQLTGKGNVLVLPLKATA